MAKNNPFICKYNPTSKTIDIKSGKADRDQLVKINDMIKEEVGKVVKFTNDTSSLGAIDTNVYTTRKISDYYYACDFIKKICKKGNYVFKDIDVVIGPIGNIMGQGTGGGFMGERAFRDGKVKLPLKLDKNTYVSPPVILINSVSYPSYADQTEILIHEYTHYLFEIHCFNYKNLYNKQKDKNYKYWFLYFSDPNERKAHINQIKFEFLIGKSYDEIIRNKVGGEINNYNYPIAVNFSKLVMEAKTEVENE